MAFNRSHGSELFFVFHGPVHVLHVFLTPSNVNFGGKLDVRQEFQSRMRVEKTSS